MYTSGKRIMMLTDCESFYARAAAQAVKRYVS